MTQITHILTKFGTLHTLLTSNDTDHTHFDIDHTDIDTVHT